MKIIEGTFCRIKETEILDVYKIDFGDTKLQGSIYVLKSYGLPPDEITLQRIGSAHGLQEKEEE